MKRSTVYFIIFQFIFPHISLGQPYNPLIKNNPYWDMVNTDGLLPCFTANASRTYIHGDTLIGGQRYHVLHAYSVVSTGTMWPGFFCPPFAVDTSKNSIAGFIREDTLARKVYIYSFGNNRDTLLYDFSLTQGDTLKAYYSKNVIDSVGVTTLINGEKRKIFYIHGTAPNKSYYIEGIGGSMGIITPLYLPLGGEGELVCAAQKNVRLWGQQCFDQLMGINTVSGNDFFTIAPNPSQDFIRINRSKATPAVFNVYDFTGRILVSEKLANTFELIDIRQFVSGVYFYNCQYNESEKVSGKIVVVR